MDVLKTRALYESFVTRDEKTFNGRARTAFVNMFRHRLGLCDMNGNVYKDRVGNREIRECKDADPIDAGSCSFKELMESIVGPMSIHHLADNQSYANWMTQVRAVQHANPGDTRALLETTGVGISPSAFADINAWTAINSGLIERRILEKFQNPEFIGDVICPDEQTKIAEGQKVIGTTRLGPFGQIRNPGDPHPRAAITERWVVLPRTNEWALATDVTREAAFFDLTGQVLEEAGANGDWLAFQKELRKIDAMIGVTGQPWSTGGSTDACAFNYKGTKYQLYNTTANAIGVLNAQTGNGMVGGDITTFQNSWLLFQRVYDPDAYSATPQKLLRVMIMPDTVVVNPGAAMTADLIVGAKDVQRRTAGTSTQANAATLNVQNFEGNPIGRFGVKRVLSSPLLEQRCRDTDGLALSQSATDNAWWHLASGKAFKNMVNWPLQAFQAPATSNYEMLDRGLIQSVFASERSTPSVHAPWASVQNKA